MKCPAVCLVALALLGNFTCSYSEDPKPEPKPEEPLELRYPVLAATVAVECTESAAHVEVKKDFFGIGQLINSADLTLGNCGAVGEDGAAQVLIYESALQDCQSTLVTTEDSLIYTFTLNYNPQPFHDSPVVRTSKVAVIECHYQRNHNASSLPLSPAWVPFSAVKVGQEFLHFTMKLMTDDWEYEKPNYQYFLGDLINIDVMVQSYHHYALRVYVDSCVATLSSDYNSSPRYVFIDNYGCLVDARIKRSSSRYVSRPAVNRLRFQLGAFRVFGTDSGSLYITCHLKARSTDYQDDSTHRACSYDSASQTVGHVPLGERGGMTGESRWTEIDGSDSVCSSCEQLSYIESGRSRVTSNWSATSAANPPSSGGRKARDVSKTQTETFEWVGDVTVGPISIAEKPLA